MITTVQLNETTKRALERLKERKETYEEVIVNLIREKENNTLYRISTTPARGSSIFLGKFINESI